MSKPINREKLKKFILRRQINTLSLFATMGICAVITLIAALSGFSRTDVLAAVTILMLLLCFIQVFRQRKSFRTLRSFKGSRKKKNKEDA